MTKKIDLYTQYCFFPNIYDKQPDYIGMRIKKSEKNYKIVFPVNYYTSSEKSKIKENSNKLINDIVNLLTAIYKTNESENNLSLGVSSNECPLASYLWIIKNYLENGYFVEYEDSYSRNNKGKIDWKKTIKNNKFNVINDKNDIEFIYSEYIVKQSFKNINSIITKIHKYCVNEAVKYFGPLLGITLDELSIDFELDLDISQMIYFLRKEYNVTFLDSKKVLLEKMLDILEWLENDNVNYDMFSIETNKFELVFEKLIDMTFGNISNINDYYPTAKWHINGNIYPTPPLREDTILDLYKWNKEEKLIIIDSKYYMYAYYNNEKKAIKLPATAAIAKQIIYGEFVKQINKSKTIYNVFLIPYNSESNEFIENVGFAEANWKSNKRNEQKYEQIYTFKIDLKSLINKKKSKKEFVMRLIELINEMQNNIISL